MSDGGSEGFEEGWAVDHFHGGDLAGGEGDVAGFEREGAEGASADAEGGGVELGVLPAIGEGGLLEEGIPF